MKLLYHGPLWYGSTSLQRAQAFAELPGIQTISSDNGQRAGGRLTFMQRVRWRLRWPADISGENDALISAIEKHQPNIAIVDNCKVIRTKTLRHLRGISSTRLVYYTPDDIMAAHNLSHYLRQSFADWDVFFTTKSFNVQELTEAGVKRPLLVGKSFDLALHTPMAQPDVGPEYEAFDIVFIGTYEKERCESINFVAKAGLTVVVYGSGWNARLLHPSVVLRPSVYADDYRRCWHHGKLALCFLRKINRDRITQRTMEIAAMGRPMLAEKTAEHDEHFLDGKEYLGFDSDQHLLDIASSWLARPLERQALGQAARERCLNSGYSSAARARWMVDRILETPIQPHRSR